MALMGGSCNGKESRKLTLPVDSIRSTLLACYYQDINVNGDVTELKLHENYLKLAKPFNQQEIKVPVKGENFLSPYIDGKNRYYEMGYFLYRSNTYKLIIYNKIGEADTLLLNVQVNSYDEKGNLVDALLVGSFFGYEDIVRFSDFVIHPDYTIDIDIYVIYRYTENEDGSVKVIKDPIPQIYLKSKYQIENGRFELISRNETPRSEKVKRVSNIPCHHH